MNTLNGRSQHQWQHQSNAGQWWHSNIDHFPPFKSISPSIKTSKLPMLVNGDTQTLTTSLHSKASAQASKLQSCHWHWCLVWLPLSLVILCLYGILHLESSVTLHFDSLLIRFTSEDIEGCFCGVCVLHGELDEYNLPRIVVLEGIWNLLTVGDKGRNTWHPIKAECNLFWLIKNIHEIDTIIINKCSLKLAWLTGCKVLVAFA